MTLSAEAEVQKPNSRDISQETDKKGSPASHSASRKSGGAGVMAGLGERLELVMGQS